MENHAHVADLVTVRLFMRSLIRGVGPKTVQEVVASIAPTSNNLLRNLYEEEFNLAFFKQLPADELYWRREDPDGDVQSLIMPKANSCIVRVEPVSFEGEVIRGHPVGSVKNGLLKKNSASTSIVLIESEADEEVVFLSRKRVSPMGMRKGRRLNKKKTMCKYYIDMNDIDSAEEDTVSYPSPACPKTPTPKKRGRPLGSLKKSLFKISA